MIKISSDLGASCNISQAEEMYSSTVLFMVHFNSVTKMGVDRIVAFVKATTRALAPRPSWLIKIILRTPLISA